MCFFNKYFSLNLTTKIYLFNPIYNILALIGQRQYKFLSSVIRQILQNIKYKIQKKIKIRNSVYCSSFDIHDTVIYQGGNFLKLLPVTMCKFTPIDVLHTRRRRWQCANTRFTCWMADTDTYNRYIMHLGFYAR